MYDHHCTGLELENKKSHGKVWIEYVSGWLLFKQSDKLHFPHGTDIERCPYCGATMGDMFGGGAKSKAREIQE